MARTAHRTFGDSLGFKSLSRAPINELGVVYLFGVLHDVYGYEIESIQAGFPDCIARRRIKGGRWEELRVEFEYESKSFVSHGHEPAGVDMIVCWKHNWPECPKGIEITELSSFVAEVMKLRQRQEEHPGEPLAWLPFAQKHRLGGKSFAEISRLWKEEKVTRGSEAPPGKEPAETARPGKLSAYQAFAQKHRREGRSLAEISKLWKEQKET
jgi:hypothetical protein